MNPLEFVQKHPVGVGVGIFAAGALYLVLSSGGSGGTTVVQTGADAATVQANTQLQMAQLQAQTQIQGVNAQAGVEAQKIAGDVTIAQLAAQVAINNNTIAGDVAKYTTNSNNTANIAISTLNAQVQNRQTDALVQQSAIQAAAYTTINKQSVDAQIAIAQAPYTAQMYISDNQLKASLAANLSQQQVNALEGQITTTNNTVTANKATYDAFAAKQNTYNTQQSAYDTALQTSLQRVSTNISASFNQSMVANPLTSNTTPIPKAA